jgi:oligopeptide/dipeptide ABC transporter ATP-binding protein
VSRLVGSDGPLKPLLQVRGLKKYFPLYKGFFGRHAGDVKAVDGVDFDIYPRETLGVVGESGCGKTTVGRTILRLIEPTAGTALFEDKDVFSLERDELRALRRNMQIIFQDPYSSLNPRMTVGAIIGDALELHGLARGDERFDVAKELLERVGLQGSYINRYPHEFSGGQRQRIGIARAVALKPRFIVCDESVSALDVSVQAQILNLLMDLQRDLSLSYMFIAHDLSVVKHISDRVAVMYLGRVVELSVCDDLYENPLHPYTQALLSAIPHPSPTRRKDRVILQGDVPNPIAPPPGCHFHPRCPLAFDRCREESPELVSARDGHKVACHLYDGAGYPVEPIPITSAKRTPPPRGADSTREMPAAADESGDGFDLFNGTTDADKPVGIPEVLKGRAGMMLGPFGEVIDPEDSFISTAEIPTIDKLREMMSGAEELYPIRDEPPTDGKLPIQPPAKPLVVEPETELDIPFMGGADTKAETGESPTVEAADTPLDGEENTERFAALTDPDQELTEFAPALAAPSPPKDQATTDPGAAAPKVEFSPLPPAPSVEHTGSMPPIHDEDGTADDISLQVADQVPVVAPFEETIDMPVVDDAPPPEGGED